MRIRRKTIVILASALILGQASVAAAADVCLSSGGILPTGFVLKKVKALKKAGSVSPLSGYAIDPLGSYAVSGAAIVYGDGTIGVGLDARGMENGQGDFSASWIALDATLQGTARLDTDGDFQRDDATMGLSTVDCASVPNPM